MTAPLVTDELLALQSKKQLEVLLESPVFRPFVLDWQSRKEAQALAGKQVAIDFSNKESFTLAGSEVPLSIVAMVAYGNLAVKEEKSWVTKYGQTIVVPATPALSAIESEAWDILHLVKEGKMAQGVKFLINTEGLRSLLG